MIEIDLIRHVKVLGKPALYGSTDIAPIATENARLLERLVVQQQTNKAYQSIVCSPLMRCQLLAKEFSDRCQLPLEISPELQEMNFGCFDGVPFDDLIFKDTTVKNTSFTKIRMILAHILQLDWQQASWYQKLQLGHGSISRILISQPYQGEQLDQTVNQTQTKYQAQYQQLNQQVTTIAMPFLEEI